MYIDLIYSLTDLTRLKTFISAMINVMIEKHNKKLTDRYMYDKATLMIKKM